MPHSRIYHKICFVFLAFLAIADQLRADTEIPDVFVNAKRTRFKNDQSIQEFDGDAIVIGAGVIITADRISLDRNAKKLEGIGNVLVLSPTQLFTGSSIYLDIATYGFVLRDAQLFSQHSAKIESKMKEILGFNQTELDFEASRKERLRELEVLRSEMRNNYRLRERQSPGGPTEPEVESYARNLEQDNLIRGQPNPAISAKEDRKKARRDFWAAARKEEASSVGPASTFFQLDGKEIKRSETNQVTAEEAFWTPCYCDDDEIPAWGFRADSIVARQEGYADLSHAILEVKGVPVLYLPWLKVPVKGERQSGFLSPLFSFQRLSGNIYSQPIFLDFGPSVDMTFTPDFFENRGPRLGLEFRKKTGRYSGWVVSGDAIHDKLWASQRGQRLEVVDDYSRGLEEAFVNRSNNSTASDIDRTGLSARQFAQARLSQPDYWQKNGYSLCLSEQAELEKCLEANRSQLDVPSNTWRHSYRWNGLNFLGPRLSVATKGEIWSDHRYGDDLNLPGQFDLFFRGTSAPSRTKSSAITHLDGTDLYVGAKASVADNTLVPVAYSGKQIPGQLNLESRAFVISGERFPVPVYTQFSADHWEIKNVFSDTLANRFSLGDGSWNRAVSRFGAPLTKPSTIIQVDQFTELEARWIEFSSSSEDYSRIRTWVSGFTFRLPMYGRGKLPTLFAANEPNLDGEQVTNVLHQMDWVVTAGTRPSVVREGKYGIDAGGPEFPAITYLASDAALVPSQFVNFSTSHSWSYYNEGWKVLTPELQAPSPASTEATNLTIRPEMSFRDQARTELVHSADREISNVDEMMDPSSKNWLVNRYVRSDSSLTTPITFDGSIGFDFLIEKMRQEQLEENRRIDRAAADNPDDSETLLKEKKALAQSWSPFRYTLGLVLNPWNFKLEGTYNLYEKLARKVDAILGVPTVFGLSSSLKYSLQKDDPTLGADGKFVAKQTRLRELILGFGRIPHVNIQAILGKRNQDGDIERYLTNYGIVYSSPSRCWSLSVARTKDYKSEENQANYLLTFNVIFGQGSRSLPNLAPTAGRLIDPKPES